MTSHDQISAPCKNLLRFNIISLFKLYQNHMFRYTTPTHVTNKQCCHFEQRGKLNIGDK